MIEVFFYCFRSSRVLEDDYGTVCQRPGGGGSVSSGLSSKRNSVVSDISLGPHFDLDSSLDGNKMKSAGIPNSGQLQV